MDEHPDEPREYRTVGNNNNLDKSETMDTKKIENKITETGDEKVVLPSGPTYHMIMSNKIGLIVQTEPDALDGFELIPHSVSVPDYYVDIKSISANRLHLNAELIKRTFYFGKPTKISNIFTNEEVLDFVNKFNTAKPAYIRVAEYDNNDNPVIESTYTNPQIAAVNFCNLDIKNDGYKSLQFMMTFDEMENRPAK